MMLETIFEICGYIYVICSAIISVTFTICMIVVLIDLIKKRN